MTFCTKDMTLTVECEYRVDPGYPATRIYPGEAPSVEGLSITVYLDGEVIELPDDLLARLTPSEEALIKNANECLEQAACDAADARRDAA
jgi:hypothetical protein